MNLDPLDQKRIPWITWRYITSIRVTDPSSTPQRDPNRPSPRAKNNGSVQVESEKKREKERLTAKCLPKQPLGPCPKA